MPLSPRWQWKLRQYQNKIDRLKEQWDDLFKASKSKTRICPSCRALLGADVSRCPFCDAHVTAINRVGVQRVTGSILPEINYSYTLAALNFVLFGVTLVAASKSGAAWESVLSSVPGQILVDLGSNFGPYVIYYHQYWRLLSGAFLHGNLLHLLFNMYALGIVCPMAEEFYGSSRFIVAYVWAAICGSLASVIGHGGGVNMVGASGAIFGMFGLMIAYGSKRGGGFGAQIKSMYTQWVIYGIVFSLMPGTDLLAHLGGLVGGFLFGYIVSDSPPVNRSAIAVWRFLSYGAWLAIAGSLVFVGRNMGNK